MSIYKSIGKTPKDAFEQIWSLMKYNDDYCLRKTEEGRYEMRLVIKKPTKSERENFEIKKL